MPLKHRFPSYWVFILLLLVALLVSGCGSSKKAVDKKVNKVSEITHKDIKETEKETLKKEIQIINENTSISITPQDPYRETVFIKGKDTLKVINGKIDVHKSSSTSSASEKQTKEKTKEDNSEFEKDSYSKELTRDVERGSGFFSWIGILVFILILLYLVYRLAKKYSWFGKIAKFLKII